MMDHHHHHQQHQLHHNQLASDKFSDYLFAKMGPPIAVGCGGGGGIAAGAGADAECPRKTTDSCEAPVELTGARKWLSDNLMLLLTLSGVLFGVILGEWGGLEISSLKEWT